MKTEMFSQPAPQEDSGKIFHLTMLKERLDEEDEVRAQKERVINAGRLYIGYNKWFQQAINKQPELLDDPINFEKYNKAQQSAHERLLEELSSLNNVTGREIYALNELASNRDEARLWAVGEFRDAQAVKPEGITISSEEEGVRQG